MSDGYPLRPLGEVMRLDIQRTPMVPATAYRLAGVLNAGQGLVDKGELDGADTEYAAMNVLRAGQVVMRKLTAWEGPITVVPAEFDGFVASNEFPTFTLGPELVPDWMRHVCRSPRLWAEMKNRVSGTVQRRKRLNPEQLLQIQLPIPPREVQAGIVEMLDAVDDQIIALDAEVDALDGVYRSFLLLLGARYGEVKISEVVSGAFAGGTPSRSQSEFYGGDIPWLKSGEVENDSIVTASEFITEAGLQGSSAKMVPAGATVVAMYGQGDTKGRAGFVKAPISTNQAVVALVPNESVVLPRFLLHAVRSKTDDLRHRAVGSSQPNLSKSLVLTQTIPMPDSLADQERALVAIDSVRATQAAARTEAARLRGVRAGLLSGLLDRTIEIESAELEV
jgi:type I restriction enzyme, S subunit